MYQRQQQPSLAAVDMGTSAHHEQTESAVSYWLTSASLSQVSDWAVDYGVPGGTDKEGWQYAADFSVYDDFKHVTRTVARYFYLTLIYVVFIQDVSWL